MKRKLHSLTCDEIDLEGNVSPFTKPLNCNNVHDDNISLKWFYFELWNSSMVLNDCLQFFITDEPFTHAGTVVGIPNQFFFKKLVDFFLNVAVFKRFLPSPMISN